MGRCQPRGSRDHAGGIKGLADFLEEHREALNYDLLTRTGHTVDDAGRSLSWRALGDFLQCLPPNSAIGQKLRPEMAAWDSRVKTNSILADIYDAISEINVNLVRLSGKKALKAKSYPRPTAKEKKTMFKAKTPAEMKRWIEEKRRKKHAR